MVTLDKMGGQSVNKSCEFIGLSTDTKPIENDTTEIPNGSSFLEMDTVKVYFYDKQSKVWREA